MTMPGGCQKGAPGESSLEHEQPELAAELAVVAGPRLLEHARRCSSSSFCLKKAVP